MSAGSVSKGCSFGVFGVACSWVSSEDVARMLLLNRRRL